MLTTYARIENGAEAETIVLRSGETLPDGDWRPVVVEGAQYDPRTLREVSRSTRIDTDKVARVIHTEPVPPPTREEYGRAVEAHVDTVARSRGYANAAAMVTYETSTVPQFAAEAQALKVWRDSVWVAVAGVEAAVLAGQRPPPSIPDLIAELPPIVWPDAPSA